MVFVLNVISASAKLPTSLATSKLNDALFASPFEFDFRASTRKRVKFFLCVSIRFSKFPIRIFSLQIHWQLRLCLLVLVQTLSWPSKQCHRFRGCQRL